MNLRPYQEQILNETRQHMRNGFKTVAICSPTGSGKTMLTATMLQNVQKAGMPSLFLCHRRELIKQTHIAFNEMNISHGIIGGGFHYSGRQLVTIASIQTMKNYIKKIKKPYLIVWDEFHHLGAKTWGKIYDEFPEAYHVGLSATPERLDGTGLSRFFQKMVFGPTVQELIDLGYLSPYKIFAPANLDLSGVHKRMGDFISSELANKIDKPTITGDMIKEYQKYANGKRAIFRGVSVEHSKHVAEQFNLSGISAQHVDGKTPPNIRDSAIDSFRKGNTLVLCNVDLFEEGVDIPAVECVIDGRPTVSITKALQFWGRALRPLPGKEYAVIIDHASNSLRHGLPCDIREWSLEGRIKKTKEEEDNGPKIKLCPKCVGANQSWRKECQYCKSAFVVQSREVDHKDGELTEIDVHAIRKNKRMEEGRCQTLEELEELGRQRGYKPGWAGMRWRSRQPRKVEQW